MMPAAASSRTQRRTVARVQAQARPAPEPARLLDAQDAGTQTALFAPAPDGSIWRRVIRVPMRVASEPNLRFASRGGAFAAAKRHQDQKRVIRESLDALLGTKPPLPPLHVTLVRVGPSLFDDDNLRGAFKSVRDAIAHWLGVNDRRRDLVRYHYDQRREGRGVYAVEITFERREIR